MSHLINPLLVDGFVDDEMGQSVQGAYQGKLDAPQEIWLDRKLKSEREERIHLAKAKVSVYNRLNDVVEKIVRLKKRGVKDEELNIFRAEALKLKEKFEYLKSIRI